MISHHYPSDIPSTKIDPFSIRFIRYHKHTDIQSNLSVYQTGSVIRSITPHLDTTFPRGRKVGGVGVMKVTSSRLNPLTRPRERDLKWRDCRCYDGVSDTVTRSKTCRLTVETMLRGERFENVMGDLKFALELVYYKR